MSLNSRENLPDILKESIREFIVELRESICSGDDEESDLYFAEFYFRGQNEETIMNRFIQNVLPHSEMIKNKNKAFFIENDHIFAGLPPDKIGYYKNKLVSEDLEEVEVEAIWDWFNLFVKISEEFKKKV